MGRRKKPPRASNHAGQLLADMRARAALTLQQAGDVVGVSRQAVHAAECGKATSMGTLMAIAHACGATLEELDRLPALVALDKGTLEVPAGTSEAMVRQARCVLEGRMG